MAAAALTLLVVGCLLLANSSSHRVNRTALEGVRNLYYKNGNEALYRKIKDLYGWKIDWAMGGDQPETPLSEDRLDTVATDAGHVASYLQIAELPPDMRAAIDPTIDPCDDFYEFACGHWEESKGGTIPKDASSVALQWDEVDKDIETRMRALFETDEGPAGLLYRSCLAGTQPTEAWDVLTPWVDLAETVKDNTTFVNASIQIQKADMTLFWSWSVDIDSWNKDRYALFFKPAHTMVSKSDLKEAAEGAEESKHIKALRDLVTDMVSLAGYDDATAKHDADNVVAIEMMLAVGQNDSDAEGGYDQWVDRDYLKFTVPEVDWDLWFNEMNFSGVGVGDDDEEADDEGQPLSSPRLIIQQGDYLDTLSDILQCKDVYGAQLEEEECWDRMESYIRFKTIYNYASYLDEDYVDAVHEWHNKRYGKMAKKQRWKKCYSDTSYLLGWASSYLYVEKEFPKARKEATLDMLTNIRAEFNASLATTRWMDRGSRVAAQEKLRLMFFEVAYPDEWPESVFRNEGQLRDKGYPQNIDIIGYNAVVRATVRVYETPHRNRWGESYPIVVNAFYSPMVNGLWVPAGIIHKPFYSEEFDEARNYGALGTICGHEMTHGFDDTGHLLDGNGDQKDWWDPDTFNEFDKRADCLAQQYDEYGTEKPDWFDGKHVDGEATLGENIADEGGMRFAFQAFEKSHPTERKSMAAHRLFFTAFAQNWCEKDSKESAIDALWSDEHSPAKYRVLGVLSNFAPFSKAFQCPLGSPMNPRKKCELW